MCSSSSSLFRRISPNFFPASLCSPRCALAHDEIYDPLESNYIYTHHWNVHRYTSIMCFPATSWITLQVLFSSKLMYCSIWLIQILICAWYSDVQEIRSLSTTIMKSQLCPDHQWAIFSFSWGYNHLLVFLVSHHLFFIIGVSKYITEYCK